MPQQFGTGPLDENVRRLIGRGLSFPFSFQGGKPKATTQSDGIEKINQSIHQILATRTGERMFIPEFGSRLPDLVFEQNDEVLHNLLSFHTAEALRRWENRIEITTITIIDTPLFRDNNQTGIQINYFIKKSHSIGSYVYPFQRGGLPLRDTVTFDARLGLL